MRLHLLRAAAFVLVFFTSILAFASAPTATTSAATMFTTSSAVLNGAGDPNGQDATGWFRYDTTNPGTCNDAFGTRVPATSGTDLGTGSASVPYSITATGLSSGVTYYFCAIVSNASGTAFGAVLSFTVPGVPQVVTSAATGVTSSGATLQGSANPVASSTTGWFRYDVTSPGACNDTFGTRAPASGGSTLGSGTSSIAYSLSVSGLLPGTTYYVCAIASNALGTGFGTVLSFTTPAIAPAVTTNAVTLLASTTVTLNGTANPDGDVTTGWFRYATTNPGGCNDSFGTRAPASGGSPLGSGTSGVGYSQAITGLTPLTAYYACAIAQNPEGLSFGAVVSFTTLATPTVTTTAVTNLTNTSAYLNGSANPNGNATTGWFRFALTSPGTCNDTFGSRVPASGGTTLGSGTSAVAYSQQITSLSAGTTYYYCAIASNSVGTGFGAVLSFTTSGVPAVTTSAATGVASTAATLNGSVNPDGNYTYATFSYSTTNPGSCNNSFGNSTTTFYPGSGTTAVGYSYNLTGLTPATTYYYCALAYNTYGYGYGAVLSFTTPAQAPTVTTNAASPLTGTAATLNGTANPGGDTTTGWFRYATASPGSCNDSFGTRAPASGGSALGSGNAAGGYLQAITGLTPGTTYYFCAIAQNPEGIAFGAVVSFLTPLPPTVTTTAATNVTNTTGYINGSGTPNGAATTGWLRYSTTSPGTCNDTFGSRVPASGGSVLGSGYSAVGYSYQITALTPGTTYYYCAIVSSSEGTAFGAVLSFAASTVPAMTTLAATGLTSTTATLNGTANPDGNYTYASFSYSTTNPGSCNNSFGTSTSTSYPGSGNTAVAYSYTLGGLLPATTYYYCALAYNTYGYGYGAVLSFTTVANPPTVTTNAPSPLTGTTATLNATANPGGDVTTGWFRYATSSPGSCNDTFGTRAPASGGAPLGSGTAAMGYSQAITGLTPGATYYYCAIVQNPEGTAFGAVVSFLTPLPPTVTTTAATNVTNTTAYINGSGTPNGAATTGWLRYSTTSPGTCNDTFGSRVPASGGSVLGSGYSAVGYSYQITALTPGTTYYYCAIVSSSEGTAFGAVLSFAASTVPAMTTLAATGLTSTTATLNGTANPDGNYTYASFSYSTTNPGSCNSSFGTSTSTSYPGSGNTAVAYSYTLGGLLPATTYYYCALAYNTYGYGYGAVLSFTTVANPPTVTTNAPSPLTGTTATLNATGNPGGDVTTGWFRYATSSPGSCNDTFGTRAPASGGAPLGSGTAGVGYSQAITGLTPGVTYYYCAIVQNPEGTAFGAVVSFLTPLPPTVTTTAATNVTNTTGYINGSGTPNGAATTGWLRFALTSPGTCNDTFGSRVPASGGSTLGSGYSAVGYSYQITALTPGTTYYYCAIVSSSEGTAFGAVLSFAASTVPAMTTLAATGLTSTTATLNGTANPDGNYTYASFSYSTTNPGSCNSSFGTSTSTSYPGSGTTAVAYSYNLGGLTPATTYYYCALAYNNYGYGYGAVLSFTTPATAPIVTTNAASPLTGTTATLNATANPGGDVTTGWFRYATSSPGSCNDTFGTRAPASGGAPLGSGTSGVPYSQAITGLTAGTTYYYCAIVQNPEGTAFGAVVSFLTPLPPTVTTTAATNITNTTAYINGSGTPNGAATTGWLRFALTSPGTCNDTFGSRVPASGGSVLGSGYSAVGYSYQITGLTPGTTYYYCAIVSSSEGTAFGAVLSFAASTVPAMTTLAATGFTPTTATLNGSVNPDGNYTYASFSYSTTNPGSCNSSFGTSTSTFYPGSGTTAVGYSYNLGGLTPATTYYYCALAYNTYGYGYGAVLSFTTPATAPAVTTQAASVISTTGATLNAQANPEGDTTTGWFRYATASPGSCNDSFGTRAPASSGSPLGGGTAYVAYSQAIAGLNPATTYYFCAIASNPEGLSFGSVLSFTTTAAPTVSTLAATPVTATTATLNGTANPNGYATTGWFEYSTTNPGSCSTSFGTMTATSSLGSGTNAVALSQALTGLTPATTYYFCAIAQSSIGTSLGAVLSFTTPAAPPSVTTVAATAITAAAATLNASDNPNGSATTSWFRYSATSPGICNDTFGTRVPASGGDPVGSGSSPVADSQGITGLAPGTTYYFCALASSAIGNAVGSVLTFATGTMASSPVVTTQPATGVSVSAATLNGSATPDLSATTGWFRYDTTSPGSCNDTFGTRAPASGGAPLGAGSAAVAYAQTLSGLTSATTYYFCAIAQNAVGTSFGAVLTFTTAASPAVTTLAASAVTGTGATLNGSANPNLLTATGWFRYDTNNPGTCNDTFGTRTPASSGTALGAGSGAVPYAQTVSGLVTGTTYYFCAIASNSAGTGVGTVMSFTTTGAPVVTTLAATGVADVSATLNGSASPNLLASTGWFRYSTTSPGTCNDTFGTRAPASSGTALGAGASAVPYAQSIAGLTAGTTYYFCAIASNAQGTGFGAVLTLTTELSNGAACSTASQCTSDFCVDGVCCNSACPGLCQACSAAKKGTGADGVCGNIQVGLDPDNECAQQAPSTCGQNGFCSGSGTCQLYVLGTACGGGCSGNVATGEACDGAGNCNQTGSMTSCSPYLCSAGACTSSCVTSADCAAGYLCNGSGACVLPTGNGSPCASSASCSSGFCVDGVCCGTACAGLCQACTTAKKGSGADGACGPIAANTDPDSECATQPASTCGTSGNCDGAGNCQLYASGTSCGSSVCIGSTVTPEVCNGTGTCQAGTGTSCSPYACSAGACKSACAVASDCASGFTCVGGTCQAPKINGAACALGTDCQSSFCVDGVCCGTACTGLCQACTAAKQGSGADGTCGPIAASTDPDNECATQAQTSCGQTGNCDGAGACQLYASGTSCGGASCQGTVLKQQICNGTGTCATAPLGTDCAPYVCSAGACKNPCAQNTDCISGDVCNQGACVPPVPNGTTCTNGSQCQSGFCADGVCCNTACTGLCQACTTAKKGSGSDGACGPVAANTDPDNECAQQAQASCGTTGNCDGAGACQLYASGVNCGTSSCQGTVAKGQICDGNGNCAAQPNGTDCTPYICSGGACKNPCTTANDCQGGYFCSQGACKPVGTNGTPCMSAAECQTGFCVDGVCCDTVCTGLCSACSAEVKGQGADGTCGPVKAGTDSAGGCAKQAPATCGLSGLCDGNGACAKYVAGTDCVAASCTAETATTASQCDGMGTCLAGTTATCVAGYTCVGTLCATSCTDNTSCAPGFACDTSFGGCVQSDAGAGDAGPDAGDAGTDAGDAGMGDAGMGGAGMGGMGGAGMGGSGPDAGDAGDAGDSGMDAAGGASGSGGMGGSSMHGSGGSGTGGDRGSTSSSSGSPVMKGGCGCRVVGGSGEGGSIASLVALALLATRRRRRRA